MRRTRQSAQLVLEPINEWTHGGHESRCDAILHVAALVTFEARLMQLLLVVPNHGLYRSDNLCA
jgi:hypothetical protein